MAGTVVINSFVIKLVEFVYARNCRAILCDIKQWQSLFKTMTTVDGIGNRKTAQATGLVDY